MKEINIEGFGKFFKSLYRRDWESELVDPSVAGDMPEVDTGCYMSYSGEYAGKYLIEPRLEEYRIICYKDSSSYSGSLNDCFNWFVQKNGLNMIAKNGVFTGNFKIS